MKALIGALLGATVLAGCVAVPYYPAEPAYGATVVVQPGHPHYHDRDGDGIRNRRDRDRDGDRVPNGQDRRPDNPYRY